MTRQAEMVLARIPLGIATSLVVATTIALVVGAHADRRAPILAWWLTNLALGIWRCLHGLAARRERQAEIDPVGLRRRLVLEAGCQGLLWAMLGTLLLPSQGIDRLFVIMTLSGMTGGAVVILSPLLPAYLAFVVPTMLPACIRLLAASSTLDRSGGFLGLVYFAAMLTVAGHTSRWGETSLRAAQDREDLVSRLRVANADLEAHKAELERVVEERTLSLSQLVGQLAAGLREKEAERARAAQSDAKHRSLLQAIREGFGHVDENEVFRYANPAAERIFGVAPGALVGRCLLEFLDPSGRQRILHQTGRRREGRNDRYQCTIVLEDGRHRLLQVDASPILGASGQYLGSSALFEDITERKATEDALNHAQRLESIGRLAGGVAHDMNNVLGAVQAVVQTIEIKHLGEAALLGDLEIIDRAATRGRDLVKRLTNFVRKDLEEPELLDLNAMVREEAELLDRTTLKRVSMVLELEPDLAPVLGERGGLGSALMNLCVNALDAMDDKGTLTLRTRSLGRGQVGLSVEDTGKGMSREVLDRAMEPFFTTKAIGKGTGLGLAMVYATAKAHGGSVDLASKVGQGTTVTLRLPTVRGSARGAGTGPKADHVRRCWRILLVDDDDLILSSVPLMLAQHGHAVTTAASGVEALARLTGGLAVDLVILDLNMPGLNGIETLERLRGFRADLPVLMATGFLDPDTEGALKHLGKALSITKPFSMADLDGMLKRVAVL